MSKARIAAAIVSMLLVQWSTGTLLALTTSINGSVMQSVISSLVGAFAGGFIAKRSFVVPALVVWAFLWGLLMYVAHDVASQAGTAAPDVFVGTNVVPALASGLAVLAGALAGQKTSSHPRIAAST